jgi:hypothetical protein
MGSATSEVIEKLRQRSAREPLSDAAMRPGIRRLTLDGGTVVIGANESGDSPRPAKRPVVDRLPQRMTD